MRPRFIAVCLLFFLFVVVPLSFAETKEITSKGKFVMGDLDSKSDARQVAIMNAKQMALEEAGVYLTSVSEVKNYELTKDEISSLAAGIVSTKVLDEKWEMEGESPVVIVVISAVVDMEDLMGNIETLKNNDELVNDMSMMQSELESLRNELDELKKAKEAAGKDDVLIDSKQKEERVNLEKATIQKMIALENIRNARFDIEKGQSEQAVDNLTQVIAMNPNNKTAFLHRSQAYLKSNNVEQAWHDIEAALKIDPKFTKALEMKGHILLKQNRANLAMGVFSKAIALTPDCGTCYYGRALSYMAQRQVRRANNDFRKACSLQVRRGCEEVRKLEGRARSMQRKPDQESGRSRMRRTKPMNR